MQQHNNSGKRFLLEFRNKGQKERNFMGKYALAFSTSSRPV
jgi:hypothetical protein